MVPERARVDPVVVVGDGFVLVQLVRIETAMRRAMTERLTTENANQDFFDREMCEMIFLLYYYCSTFGTFFARVPKTLLCLFSYRPILITTFLSALSHVSRFSVKKKWSGESFGLTIFNIV